MSTPAQRAAAVSNSPFQRGSVIPEKHRAEMDARRQARGWSWRRFAAETGLCHGTVYGAVHRAFPCSEAVRNSIETALASEEGETPGALLEAEPDPDSIEWAEALVEADRRFAAAMLRSRFDFSGNVRAA